MLEPLRELGKNRKIKLQLTKEPYSTTSTSGRAVKVDAPPPAYPGSTGALGAPPGFGSAPAPAPTSQPGGSSLMNITIPVGMGPGSVLTVRAPDGNMFAVTVPPGSYPGSTIQICAPAPGPRP